ncbi:MAG: FxsA family protein [bacterium]|nr:FxsA family protein [bacterium]
MFPVLLFLFVAVPVVEVALLIRIGRAIDFGPTIALVVITGVLGAALARHQGVRTLARIQEHMSRGTMPTTDILDGLMILVAGAVLITPGVLTDCFGFALLIPPARAVVRRAVSSYFSKRMIVGTPPMDAEPPRRAEPSRRDDFIDVSAREVPGASNDFPED